MQKRRHAARHLIALSIQHAIELNQLKKDCLNEFSFWVAIEDLIETRYTMDVPDWEGATREAMRVLQVEIPGHRIRGL